MSTNNEFTAEQLTAARATAWHQSGAPLLPLDGIRDWLTATGIVLFAPRPLQLPAPAPSLVEAMIGASSAGPTDGQIATARSIVARLVAEGNALPLNLLGIPGDLPDFIASAQVFSFLYTLRGDKAWKQPPSTTGATKSSPLGVRVFEVLTEKGALSAAELANELGRELTESAIQRTLTELWSNLRVIPLLPQNGDGPTLWELTSRRFTKAIKAGINAGQPTALSALISLYLAQALLATEEEVETFLSPLAARSRIREVLHALTGSRQLETIVLDGKSLMVIPGTLPEFPAIEVPEPTEEELAAAATAFEGEGRIKKFTSSSERRSIGDFKGKPARTFGLKPAGGIRPTTRKPAFGAKPAFGSKPDGERRPFTRAAKAAFTKPWEEDRKPAAEGEDSVPAKRPYTPRAANAGSSFVKKPYTPRDNAAGKPFAKRPYTPRAEDGSDAPKRPYTPRGASAGSTFAKKPYTPREGGATTGGYPKRAYAPRDSDAPKRPYTPREGGSDRPARPAFGAKRSFGDKPYTRKPFAPREGGDSSARPSFGAKRDFAPKTPYAAKRPFTPRSESSEGATPIKFRKFDAPKRPFTPREDRGGRPDKPAYGGSNSKPRAPKEDFRIPEPTGNPKRPFPRKEGDLADRPVRPWPEKTGRSDGRPGGPGSKPRAPRKDFADRGARPARPSFGAKNGEGRSFSSKPGEGRSFPSKPGGFSKRPSASGDKVSFGSKPAPRRGIPGTKPSFPRKPRSESQE